MLAIADDTTSVSLQRAYEIYARNSGWVAGTDYTIDYQVTTADGVKRTATLGSGTVYGNLRTTGIFVETDTVTVNLIPPRRTLPITTLAPRPLSRRWAAALSPSTSPYPRPTP